MTDATIHYRVRLGRSRARPAVVPPRPAKCGDQIQSASRVARFLALGHRVDQAVRDGEIDSYAEAARRLGVTPPRMNQIVQLTLLAPDIQEQILSGELAISASALRPISMIPAWRRQRQELQRLLDTPGRLK